MCSEMERGRQGGVHRSGGRRQGPQEAALGGLLWALGIPRERGKTSPLLFLPLGLLGVRTPLPSPSTAPTGTLAGPLHHGQAHTGPCPRPNPSLFLLRLPLAEKHGPCEAHRAPGKGCCTRGRTQVAVGVRT